MKRKKKNRKYLTLEDVDYEVSDGDTFLIDMKDFGEEVTLMMEGTKRKRRKR